MAQGGQNWPAGQFNQGDYHPQQGMYANAYQPGSSYDSQLHEPQAYDGAGGQIDNGNAYMNWNGMSHGAGAMATTPSAEHPGALNDFNSGRFSGPTHAGQNNHPAYVSPYYTEPPSTNAASRHPGPEPHEGGVQHSQYPANAFHDEPAFAPSDQSRGYDYQTSGQRPMWMSNMAPQHTRTASPGPGSFAGNAWQTPQAHPQAHPQAQAQAQAQHHQGAFAHQTMHYDNQASQSQPMYHQPSQSPAPGSTASPAPRQDLRAIAKAAGQPGYASPFQGAQLRDGVGHSNPQLVDVRPSHNQFPQTQAMFAPVPYSRVATGGQAPVSYQEQMRYTQSPAQGYALAPPPSNAASAPPQTMAHHAGQPMPPQRIMTPSQTSMGPAGGQMAPTREAAVQPNGVHQQGEPVAPPQLNDQENTAAQAIADPDAFDPAAAGWPSVPGCPNLFVSPEPTTQVVKSVPHDRYVARFNESHTPFIPTRQSRLPCEIERDYELCQNELDNGTLDPAQREVVKARRAELEQEKIRTTGKKVESEHADKHTRAKDIISAPRPKDPLLALEQDVVRIVWTDPETHPTPADSWVRNAVDKYGKLVREIWDVVKPLKGHLKEKKAAKELKSLQQKIDEQLSKMVAVIEACLKYARPVVLNSLGGHDRLSIILGNTLRHAYGQKDYQSPLAKGALRLMAKFTTLERDFLYDRLKLDAVYRSAKDKLDDETKELFKAIFANSVETKEEEKEEPEKKTAPKSTPKPSTTASDLTASKQVKKEPVPAKRAPTFLAKDLKSASKSSLLKKSQPTSGSDSDTRRANGDATKTGTSAPAAASIKRPREEEGDARTAKKVATGVPQGSSKLPVPSTNGTGQATSTTATPRARPAASLLPGKTRTAAKPAPKTPQSASSGLSNISGLLAEIEKPKSPPRTREEPVKPPETAEEKTRRLRKEQRRGLRVSWKPDSELEQIRLFEHDAAEDEGRAHSMTQDAHDNRSEGLRLKAANREDEDGEEEDDKHAGGQARETSLRTWREPSATDLSQGKAAQRAKSFVTRAGLLPVDSEQVRFMEDYERRQLMVFYNDPADIPETPKSPPRKAQAEAAGQQTRLVHLPADKPEFVETHRRWSEHAQLGSRISLQLAIQRLGAKHGAGPNASFDQAMHALRKAALSGRHSDAMSQSSGPHGTGPPASYTTMSQADRDAEVLRLLQTNAVKQWQDPSPLDPNNPRTTRRTDYTDPTTQANVDAFEDVAASFAGKPFPATEAPEWMRANPAYVKQWQTGYEKDLRAQAEKQRAEAQALLAVQAAAAQAYAQPTATQATQDQTAAWAAYYAQYGHQISQAQAQAQAYGQAAQQSASGYGANNDNQYAQIMQALQLAQAAPQQPQASQQPVAQSMGQDTNAQLQSLLSALGGQSAQPAAQAVPQAYGVHASDPQAYWQALAAAASANAAGQNQGQGQQGQQPQQGQQTQGGQHSKHHKNHHRDHDRDRSNTHASGADGFLDYGPSPADHDSKGSKGRKDKDNSFRNKDRKDINRALIGTKPCTFWAVGKCAKGDSCTFRHDPNDLK